MLSPFDAYVMYLALKRHFSSDYDYVKYNGRVSASLGSFEKRKDRYQFQKLAKQKDPFGLILSNMVEDPGVWVGDLFDDVALRRYGEMKKRRETMAYRFKDELSSIDELESSMKVVNGDHPHLLKLFMRGKVSPETMVILNNIGKGQLFSYWSDKIQDAYSWPDTERKLIKYSPFLNYDKAKYTEYFKGLQNHNEPV